MAPLIEVSGLCKSYGAHAVLKNVTFDVQDGEGFAIIGPNGAGKTTLFKALTGEMLVDRGTILYRGQDITIVPANLRTRMGFGRTFQVARVFLENTVIENLIIAVETRLTNSGEPVGRWYAWRPSKAIVEEAYYRLADIGLADKRFEEARNLAHGDKKRLELAIALATEPQVLMLDEPTAGMSPSERHQIVDLISRIRTEQGITVMLTEHDMGVVFGLADRILVLNYGEIIVVGAPEDVRRNPMVAEIYLGQEMISA